MFDILDTQGLIERVVQAGQYLGQLLDDLVGAFPGVVLEARGRGLLRGVAVKSAPASIIGKCRENGVLLSVAGDNVVRFAPPYIVERPQLDEAVGVLRKVLGQ
jgi:acetylornithine/N-succinyldiaminopimelate aminotransferase